MRCDCDVSDGHGGKTHRLGEHPSAVSFVACAEAEPDSAVPAPVCAWAKVERGGGGRSPAARRRAHGRHGAGARGPVLVAGRGRVCGLWMGVGDVRGGLEGAVWVAAGGLRRGRGAGLWPGGAHSGERGAGRISGLRGGQRRGQIIPTAALSSGPSVALLTYPRRTAAPGSEHVATRVSHVAQVTWD